MKVLLFLLNLANFQADKMEILATEEGRVSLFKGNVTITEGDTKITAQNAAFYQTKGLALVYDSVTIQTLKAKLTADSARYLLEAAKTVLKGKPKVFHETQVVETDSLVFDHQTGKAYTDQTVVITDTTRNLTIQGKKAEYDLREEVAHLYSEPVLTIKRGSVITVKGERMDLFLRDGLAQTVGDAILTSAKTVLQCESLVYYYNENFGLALGSPVITEGENSVSGDTVRFYTKDERLSRVEIKNNSKGEYLTEDGDRVEVQGMRITIFFDDETKVKGLEVVRPTLGNLYRHKKER